MESCSKVKLGDMIERPDKLENNWRNPDGTLKSGHPPMGGRPAGKSLKEFWRQRL
jgi:hypothetical protein